MVVAYGHGWGWIYSYVWSYHERQDGVIVVPSQAHCRDIVVPSQARDLGPVMNYVNLMAVTVLAIAAMKSQVQMARHTVPALYPASCSL